MSELIYFNAISLKQMQTVLYQIQNKASMKHCSWFFPFSIYPMQKCNIFMYYLSYKRSGTK